MGLILVAHFQFPQLFTSLVMVECAKPFECKHRLTFLDSIKCPILVWDPTSMMERLVLNSL